LGFHRHLISTRRQISSEIVALRSRRNLHGLVGGFAGYDDACIGNRGMRLVFDSSQDASGHALPERDAREEHYAAEAEEDSLVECLLLARLCGNIARNLHRESSVNGISILKTCQPSARCQRCNSSFLKRSS